jgi:hypothetical protein
MHLTSIGYDLAPSKFRVLSSGAAFGIAIKLKAKDKFRTSTMSLLHILNETGNVRINVTWRRVRVTYAAVEKQ